MAERVACTVREGTIIQIDDRSLMDSKYGMPIDDELIDIIDTRKYIKADPSHYQIRKLLGLATNGLSNKWLYVIKKLRESCTADALNTVFQSLDDDGSQVQWTTRLKNGLRSST